MTFNRIIDLLKEKNIKFYITEIKAEHQVLLKQRFPNINFTDKIFEDIETCLKEVNQFHFS